jgi:hypothetical protein
MRIFLLATFCALPGCVSGGGCNTPPTPSSETCEPGAQNGVVTEVDIGRYLDGTFEQYQDDDIVPMVFGGQGSPMIVLNLRLRGSDLPDCVVQRTRLYLDNGEEGGAESAALVADQVLPDTWITGDLLLVTYDVWEGDHATLESMAGDVTTAIGVWVDFMGTQPDAAVVVDARPPDAAPAPDANPDATP